MNDERGEIPQEAVGEGLEVDKNLKFQETIKSPEYQAKLEKVLSEVHRFAARVKELAAGKPTDAEVAQLRKGYFDLSDLALKEHDSLPNDATNEAQHSVMGVDGSFLWQLLESKCLKIWVMEIIAVKLPQENYLK